MTVADLYSDIKPSLLLDFANVKALDPRITFTRASSATYYDGKTWAKAEENLLLQSQDYSALDGWHVNIRLMPGEDAATLTPYLVMPAQPRRVWA